MILNIIVVVYLDDEYHYLVFAIKLHISIHLFLQKFNAYVPCDTWTTFNFYYLILYLLFNIILINVKKHYIIFIRSKFKRVKTELYYHHSNYSS